MTAKGMTKVSGDVICFSAAILSFIVLCAHLVWRAMHAERKSIAPQDKSVATMACSE
jgi:hypothetical protein